MSLIKQLWLGIVVLLLLALGGSFAISFVSAKTYLEEQLSLKNIDNATSLALSMSQMEKDPVTLELLISAQFDAGHYESIKLFNPENKLIVEREFDAPVALNVPTWFSRWVQFHPKTGTAQIQDGWQQYGRLEVKSHSGFAVEALWKSARELCGWFVIATLISGLFGSLVLRYVSRPLDIVVAQAEAIGERRFITSDEPRTTEFQRVVRAMNRLSNGVRLMLEKETRQLDSLRRESQRDHLTGLCNRNHFLNILDTKLTDEAQSQNGLLVIARLHDLANLNTRLGRQHTDELLRNLAVVFEQLASEFPESVAGRLNGSDFALLVPSDITPVIFCGELNQRVQHQLNASGYSDLVLPLAIVQYHHKDERGTLLHRLDGALAEAEMKGNRVTIIADTGKPQENYNLEHWRNTINEALTDGHLQLASYPVKNAQGGLVHWDTPVRLELDDAMRPAGYFMPWANRLGLLPELDLAVARAALKKISSEDQPLAINISANSLCNARFRQQLIELLTNHSAQLAKLWLDFPEVCALRHLEELRAFTGQLSRLGCRPGLEHLGLEFSEFQLLQDLGLSHLKIDSALVRDIQLNTANQSFLQGLCRIGHSLGVLMIAEGVQTDAELKALEKIGLDAFTGPYISAS